MHFHDYWALMNIRCLKNDLFLPIKKSENDTFLEISQYNCTVNTIIYLVTCPENFRSQS